MIGRGWAFFSVPEKTSAPIRTIDFKCQNPVETENLLCTCTKPRQNQLTAVFYVESL